MEKTKFAYYTDEIMRSVAIWLIGAISLRYVIRPLYLIIIVATAVTMLLTLLIRALLKKRNVSKEKLKKIDDCMRELMTLSPVALNAELAKAVDGEELGCTVSCKNTVIYPHFCGALSVERLNEGYNLALKEGKRLLVLTSEMSREAEKNLDLFSEIPVTVLKKEQSCEFLKRFNLLPKCKIRPKKKGHLLSAAFKRSKIKGYVSAAVVLMLTATFSPYAILCIIAASLNIAMSVVCEVKGK